MLLALLLAQGVGAQIMAAPSDVSPETRITIASVAAAIAKARQEQAALPPPKSDAERIVRLGQLDQAPRMAMGKIDFSKIPAAERRNAQAAIWQQIIPLDHANLAALLAMLPKEGWFTTSAYGPEAAKAAKAAFHIVQHADAEQWKRFVPVLEPLAAVGEVDGGDFARMHDRLAISEKRPQRYATQYRCDGGKWAPHPIEDAAKVDALRAALRMPTFAEEQAALAKMPPCG